MTFKDLYKRVGDLLKYLSEEHDTLREPNGDSNRSRWPLHPLWEDLRERIRFINQTGVREPYDKEAVLAINIEPCGPGL